MVSSCGVRLDTPAPAVPTADVSEQARAEAVADAQAIAAAAAAVPLDSAGAELATQIGHGSLAHADLLGGEWTAPPRPTPSSTPTPSPASTDVFGALTTGAAHAATSAGEVATAGDGDLATALVSIAVWRDFAAAQLGAAGLGAPAPTGGIDLVAIALASVSGVDPLIRSLDAAAFGYEVLAARQEDAAISADWAARATALRRAGEAMAQASGRSGTAADPREAIYDVEGLLTLDPSAAAATLETEVASTWITAALPGSLRQTAADAALQALLRASALAPAGALDAPTAVLPGLAAIS